MKSKILKFLTLAAALCGATAWGAIATQEAFVEACANAVSGAELELGNGEFAIGPVDINGKTLTFKGQGAANTKVYIGNGGYDGNGGHGSSKTANMTFEDVTLDDLPSNSGYLTGFTEAAGLTFRNVTFNVGFSNWGNKGGDVSFYNCTFNQAQSDKYCVQELRSANGTKFLFDGCTFNCTGEGRFINAYKQGGAGAAISIVVKDCTFDNSKGSAKYGALYLKDDYNDGCNVNLTFVGTNTAKGEFPTTDTGSALCATKAKGHATISIQDTLESEPRVIYQAGAQTPAWVDPNGYKPAAAAPAVAQIGDVKYLTLADALAAVGAGDVEITLLKNATLDYYAREAYGAADTTSITVNGNGKTLTLNQKNSDWSSLGLANAGGKLVLKNMTIEKTGYGDTLGTWNTHSIIFTSNVEMTDVIVNNAIAVQNGAKLDDVTINEANGYYGLWINGNGQSVTVNGGVINATNGGRGIKIADQYVDAPASVTLTVNGTKFNTAKKAAILVSSTAGANIAVSDVDITNVSADSVNVAWVDEDWAANYGKVTVTGGTLAQENIASFVASVTTASGVPAYYKDLHEAMGACKAEGTVALLKDVDLGNVKWEPVSFAGAFDGQNKTISNLTIDKSGVSNTGFITKLNGSFKNVTIKNATVTGGECTGIIAARAGGTGALAENITITGTIKVETTHSGYARAGGVVGGWAYGNYRNITIDGVDASVSYIKHTGGGDGRYVAGIVGHADGVESYVNCVVKNITISGGWLCGGIAGPGPSDGLATGCAVENIKINANCSGGMFGWYYGNGTIQDSSIKNVEFTAGTTKNGAIGGYGSNPDATVENVTIENVTNNGQPLIEHVAAIDTTYYMSLQAAVEAAKIGDTITIIANDASLSAPEGWTISGSTLIPVDKTWHIANLDQLKEFQSAVNGGNTFAGQTVVLDADIDMASVENWQPIGNAPEKKFAGTFDGQNHTIRGLKITGGSYVGLFGYLGAATVQNVALVGANVSGVKRVGALVGQIAGNATIKNCSLDATSSVAGSDSNTGGLIGEASGSIVVTLENLTNNAPVTNTESGTSRAAGILCQATSGASVTLKNCVNNGTITTNGGYAGGIVSAKQGGASLVFDGCSNTGTLTDGTKGTGALLAWSCNGSSVTISNYSGDVANAIGWLSQDNYDHVFVINGVEHYIRVAKAGSGYTFASRYEAVQPMNKSYLQEIIGFFNYAKTVNANFAHYPATPVEVLKSAYSTADGSIKGSLFNTDESSGWPQLLSQYNANSGKSLTADDFAVTWGTRDVLFMVGVVVTDTASAQAALDAATPNTTIIFKAGTYGPLFIRQTLAMSTRRSDLDMDGSYPAYLRSFKNLTLIAEEGAEVISQGITAEAGLFWHDSAPASNQAEMNRATSGFISYLALENVTIDGIAFDSSERSAVTLRDNGAVATRGNIMVDGLTIQNCTGRGVASNKNIHFLAAGAGTNDQNFPGTEKKAFNNLVVKNCILDSYYQPIAFNNATAVLNGLTVTGNTFRNCADNQLQVANKINTGTFTITGNVFDGMSGRVIRLTNAQADSQFIITGNEIRNPKTYDSGLDSYSLTKITGVDGFRVTEQTDKGWTAGSYSADGKTWVADGDKKLLVYTYDAGMLKLGLVPLTDDEVAAFTGVNVQGLKGYDNKVYPTIQAAYDELSALVAAAGVGADGVVANDKVTGLYSQIDGNKIGISWNVWGEQVLPMGDTLALGRGQGYLGSYWIRNLSIKGRNEAAQVTASKITVPWSWQYPEVNDEESVILSISGLKLLDVDTTGISFARNGIGLAGTFTLNMTRCQVSGGINMAGAYQGNSVWNINDNVFTYRTGGYKQYAIMLNGTTAGDVAKGRSTTMNFIGNTVSGYDRGVNFSWVGGSVTASGNTITPGVGYSAIQLSNGVGTTQINGNTIHLNGGNVLTIHESCVGKTMSITVQGNAIDGMGYAVYDDVAASGKDYGSSEDKANVTLVWSGNTVADGAAMDTEKGIKGTSETDLSEYVYTVLNPAGARVRHGDTVTRYPTLAAAIAAAQQGDTVELIREGTYTLPAIPLNITIKGTVEGVAFNCPGAGNIASVPNGATFENVEFTFGNSIYHGFQQAGLITMNNCTLNGLLFSYGDMNFTGCRFKQTEDNYCMWCYGKNVTYTGCTFDTAGKALNVYNEGNDAGSPWNITVSGCTFNSTVKNKAAVNIMETCDSTMLKYNVTVTDCTIGTPGFYPTGAEFNPANALWVISPLVQVDDRNTSVYPSESGITVTTDGECVYPMATMLQLPVTADGGTKLLLTVPDTFFTGKVTYPHGATAAQKAEVQSAHLATVEANRLKVWQNYVMGVNGSVAGNKLLTDYAVGGGAGDGEWITVKTPIAAFNPPTDSGITVKYRLLRTATPDGATSWQAFGELKDTPSFPVNIAGQEGDTFWKIEVVFQGEAANE